MRRIPAPLMKQSWRTIPVSRRRREGYRAGTSSGFEPPERVTSPYHRLKTRGAILAEDATPPTKGPVGEFGVKRRRPGIGRDLCGRTGHSGKHREQSLARPRSGANRSAAGAGDRPEVAYATLWVLFGMASFEKILVYFPVVVVMTLALSAGTVIRPRPLLDLFKRTWLILSLIHISEPTRLGM